MYLLGARLLLCSWSCAFHLNNTLASKKSQQWENEEHTQGQRHRKVNEMWASWIQFSLAAVKKEQRLCFVSLPENFLFLFWRELYVWSKHFTSLHFGPSRQSKDCSWNYLFLALHNTVLHCEKILHLWGGGNNSVTKNNNKRTTVLFKGLGRIRGREGGIKIRAICLLSLW